MRRTRAGGLAAAVVALTTAGCGSTAHFADRNPPPTTVDASVYISNARISVAPDAIGAGPVLFYVTNNASQTESLKIASRGGGQTLASTAPINPGLTLQVEVDFTRRGQFTVATTGSPALSGSIRSTTLHIGKPRPPANNALLQP